MEVLLIVVVVAAIAGAGYYVFGIQAPKQTAKRRAENKVKMSDPILRGDIEILEKTDSDLLNDAIALRRAQIEQGRDPTG